MDSPRAAVPHGLEQSADDTLEVVLPTASPDLTPGLARALLAAITSAAVNVGLLEGADDEAAERLAS